MPEYLGYETDVDCRHGGRVSSCQQPACVEIRQVLKPDKLGRERQRGYKPLPVLPNQEAFLLRVADEAIADSGGLIERLFYLAQAGRIPRTSWRDIDVATWRGPGGQDDVVAFVLEEREARDTGRPARYLQLDRHRLRRLRARAKQVLSAALNAVAMEDAPTAQYRITRDRGVRGQRTWRRTGDPIAGYGWELVTDPRERRAILADPAAERIFGAAFRLSPLRELVDDLCNALSNRKAAPNGHPRWRENLAFARRRVQGSRKVWDSPNYETCLRRLVRRQESCRSCRTPLIRGLYVAGRRITKARRYCDDACEKVAARRRATPRVTHYSRRLLTWAPR